MNKRFNGRVHGDLLFFKSWCETKESYIEVTALFLLDEATGFGMLIRLPSKTIGSIKAALLNWTQIFGFPEEIYCDQESAMMSDEFRAWLELHDCKMHPNPASTGFTAFCHGSHRLSC